MNQTSTSVEFRFGRFVLQPAERRLLVDGNPVAAGPRAFDLLATLVERAGHLVTKDELLARVWPNLVVEENNLQVQVSALRKILGPDAITTIPGRGYRFALAAQRGEAGAATPSEPRAHNLPRPLTTFVGRENDLEQYARLLDHTRLLTLTGIGGCGKTRLAIELAERVLPSFADGAWYVDLAPVAEPERVALVVATVLGVREEPDKPIEQTLVAYLADRRQLLVLDNCEHLLGACAALAERLLLAAPDLRVLVTSREGLAIGGEHVVPVRSLAFPPQKEHASDALLAFESVQLFVDRASAVAASVASTAADLATIGEICRRLDGIPLAIELAAARAKVLSIDQIRAKLDDRFRLLTGNARAMSRHQTLLGVLQWSYDHLADDEQRWLQRLSVFTGGWTLEAATAVAGGGCDEYETLSRLERLVDTSLVVVDPTSPDDGSRYSMLETVRQYAQERLSDAGGSDEIRERHFAYFLALAKRAHPNFFTKDVHRWGQRLDRELSNLLAAHAWNVRQQAGAQRGLELAVSMRLYWINRGLFALGQQVYVEALGRDGADERSRERGRALFAFGQHYNFAGSFADAIPLFEEALAILREHGDVDYVVFSLDKLAFACAFVGDSARALAFVDEELRIRVQAGHGPELASALNTKGAICRMLGDFESAAAALERALSLASGDDPDEVHTILSEIVRVAVESGALERARDALAESIPLLSEMDSQFRATLAIDAASLLAAAHGDWNRAARFRCVFDATTATMGGFRNPYDDRVLATVRAKPFDMLGAKAYAEACDGARGVTLQAALAEAVLWLEDLRNR